MPSLNNRFKEKKQHDGLDAYRIIDANFNRCKEGLRVCEEIARFYLQSVGVTKKIRGLRHSLTGIMKTSKIKPLLLLQYRNSCKDIGKDFFQKRKKKSLHGVFLANAQRTKESLRVLEEFVKLFSVPSSKKIQRLRFNFYALEKKIIEKFPDLLDSR